MTVKWRKYKKFSGCLIPGTVKVPVPGPHATHIERAYYLTAKLEAPTYGSVQSYDGAAMSGGPLHNIAIYPRYMKQGSLFKLLEYLGDARIYDAYDKEGWLLTSHGLADAKGSLISASTIRNTFTPNNGRVPKEGPQWEQAKQWALLHHTVLSDPETFEQQRKFAIRYLLRTQQAIEEVAYYRAGLSPYDRSVNPGLDLAFSVYHAHSVNAPGTARRVLKASIGALPDTLKFSKRLIYKLGTRKYGNWRDTLDGRNRYDRTRIHAMRSKLWPRELFVGKQAIMPKNL